MTRAPLLAASRACTAAAALVVAGAVATWADLGERFPDLRTRIAVSGLGIGPMVGGLVVAAALLARLAGRRSLPAAAVGLALVAGELAVTVAFATTPELTLAAVERTGYALPAAGIAALALVGVWLALLPEPVADPPGEAPDGGLGGGDLVGEPEDDRLFRPEEPPPSQVLP